MRYLEYSEYLNIGGKLSVDVFNLLEYEARKKIDNITFGRLKDLTEQVEEVKRCIFKLISVLNDNNPIVKSESVDGYSVTSIDNIELTLMNIIEEYLSECYLDDGTPYLYRG